MEWRSRRKVLWVWLGLLLSAAIGIGGCLSHSDRGESTKRFIAKNLTNPNGTLATYLQKAKSVNPELAAGREALSESLGLWMQAALASDDQAAFEKSYETLNRYFVTDQDYIAWKLSPEGGRKLALTRLATTCGLLELCWKGPGSGKTIPCGGRGL
ncbi:hypothetical protein ACFQY3_06865 [Paenibacillus farraposensis]|uniref:hypothetical protein n=1 Tax=Paenibacillus farraposensis TaxID=2807095 RepID=UPI0036150B5E